MNTNNTVVRIALLGSLALAACVRDEPLPGTSSEDTSSGGDTADGLTPTYQAGDRVLTIDAESQDQADELVVQWMADAEVTGTFELVQLPASGWELIARGNITPAEVVGDEETDILMPVTTSYYTDYLSGSQSSGTCSAQVGFYDENSWDAWAALYFDDGAMYGWAYGRWSGCASSGGELSVTETYNGLSLSFTLGYPSGASVTTNGSTKKQWTWTQSASSRSASIGWCGTAVEGFLTSRSVQATMKVPVSSSSSFYVTKSAKSYIVLDWYDSAPAC